MMMRFIACVMPILFVGLLSTDLLALDPQTINERVDHIKRLSKIDRERLDRNIQTFESMGNDEKARYRELHEKLAEDRKHGGTVTAMLDTYIHWLRTLPPAQQVRLLSERDSAKRIRLIRQFIEEHERVAKEELEQQAKAERERSAVPNDPAKVEPISNVRMDNLFNFLRLKKEELASAMRVIFDDLPKDKRPPSFDSLNVLNYPDLIAESARQNADPAEWPDNGLLDKLLGKLPPEKVALVTSSPKWGSTKRETAARLILMGIHSQAQQTLPRPTEDERKSALESLTKRERTNYDNLVGDAQRVEFLNRKFLEKQGDESLAKVRECRNQIFDLYRQLQVARPPRFQQQWRNNRGTLDKG